MLSTRRSRIDWIGKSVTMVRANSPKMSESLCSLDMILPPRSHTKQCRRVQADTAKASSRPRHCSQLSLRRKLKHVLAPKELRVKTCCGEMS